MDLSISNRKYKIDSSILLSIDNEYKAYFLGLLYADGSLSKTGFSINLILEDSYILETLSKNLFYDKPLYTIKPRLMKNGNLSKPQKQLAICNKKIKESVTSLGVIRNKSLILDFPSDEQLPPIFLNHFIRGYFDGDGTIHNGKTKYKKTAYKCSFVGSHLFIKKLKDILEKNNIVFTVEICGKVSKLNSTNKLEISKIYNFLYKNSNIHLHRKYKKFVEMIETTDWDKINNVKYSSAVGVTFDKRRNKWYATAKRGGKSIWLGSYNEETSAILAREEFDKQSI
jgi:hypothetical protein